MIFVSYRVSKEDNGLTETQRQDVIDNLLDLQLEDYPVEIEDIAAEIETGFGGDDHILYQARLEVSGEARKNAEAILDWLESATPVGYIDGVSAVVTPLADVTIDAYDAMMEAREKMLEGYFGEGEPTVFFADDIEGHALGARAGMIVGTDYGYYDDVETYAGDLMSNLMHLCDQENVSFSEVKRRARSHYQEEKRRANS